MSVEPKIVNPEAIESESFRIIENELEEMGVGPTLSPEEFSVLVRIIHATADFDFAKNVVFHPEAVKGATEAIKRGESVIVDVEMIRAGINKSGLSKFGGQVLSFMGDEDVARRAKELGITRAICSMRKAAEVCPHGIFAIGNAPTALFELIRLVRNKELFPSLVIGVPVGFVSAAKAKEEALKLGEFGVPYIIARGRKGGTPVAVAVVNALIKLTIEKG
jgi:precorrin-8X/cobalt-precorrin-8 methylmutase